MAHLSREDSGHRARRRERRGRPAGAADIVRSDEIRRSVLALSRVDSYRVGMRTVSWLARALVVPAVAVGLLWWWSSAELGRTGEHVSWWVAVLLFGALACAWAAPHIAVAALYGAFLLQVVRVDFRFDQDGWIADAAVPLAATVLAARVPERWRRHCLAVILPLGVLVGAFTNLPALGPLIESGGSRVQVGQVNGVLLDAPARFASPGITVPLGIAVWSSGAVLLIVAGWLIGSSYRAERLRWVAERSARAARAALDESRRALLLSEERSRIAREVHDITAHSLSVILAQADGASAVPGAAEQGAMRAIAGRARTALTEVRDLLETLDGDRARDPRSVDDIEGLVADVRATGTPVDLERHGPVLQLTPEAGAAAYRIAQEALTNALRHGAPGTVRVTLGWHGSGLALSVTSPLPTAGAAGRPGRGREGMRDRARAVGGWFDSGPDLDAGVYLVTAFLPAVTRAP